MSPIECRDLRIILVVSTLACALGCGTSVDRDALAKEFVSRADYDKLLAQIQDLTKLVDSETARAKQAEQVNSDELAKLNSPPANGEASSVVRTKRLEIVNDKGDIVALCQDSKEGGRFVLANHAGKLVISMGAIEGEKNPGSGHIKVHNAGGDDVVWVAGGPGGGAFFLTNRDGKPRFWVTINEDTGKAEFEVIE